MTLTTPVSKHGKTLDILLHIDNSSCPGMKKEFSMNTHFASATHTDTLNALRFGSAGKHHGTPPVPGTIGADQTLCERIHTAFAKLGKAREACFGNQAYPSALASFKRDFAIGSTQSWTVVMTWPAHRAAEILNYLDGRHHEAVGYH